MVQPVTLVTVTINGTNDTATVSSDTGSVTEDAAATLTTSGSITITDTDAGEAFAQPQSNTAGTFGTFNVDADGNWTYEADNSQTAIQALGGRPNANRNVYSSQSGWHGQ